MSRDKLTVKMSREVTAIPIRRSMFAQGRDKLLPDVMCMLNIKHKVPWLSTWLIVSMIFGTGRAALSLVVNYYVTID